MRFVTRNLTQKWPLQELLFQPGEPVLSGFDFDFNEIL